MTPSEIAIILARLDVVEASCAENRRMIAIANRLLYLLIGAVLGTGALQLSQVVGA